MEAFLFRLWTIFRWINRVFPPSPAVRGVQSRLDRVGPVHGHHDVRHHDPVRRVLAGAGWLWLHQLGWMTAKHLA